MTREEMAQWLRREANRLLLESQKVWHAANILLGESEPMPGVDSLDDVVDVEVPGKPQGSPQKPRVLMEGRVEPGVAPPTGSTSKPSSIPSPSLSGSSTPASPQPSVTKVQQDVTALLQRSGPLNEADVVSQMVSAGHGEPTTRAVIAKMRHQGLVSAILNADDEKIYDLTDEFQRALLQAQQQVGG